MTVARVVTHVVDAQLTAAVRRACALVLVDARHAVGEQLVAFTAVADVGAGRVGAGVRALLGAVDALVDVCGGVINDG